MARSCFPRHFKPLGPIILSEVGSRKLLAWPWLWSINIGKHSLSPPHIQLKFDTLLRLLRLRLRTWEVAEVASDQVKKVDRKYWNLLFLSYTNIIHLKRKLRTIFIQIRNKIRGFCYQKVEKNWFCDFRSQKIIISVSTEFLENLPR